MNKNLSSSLKPIATPLDNLSKAEILIIKAGISRRCDRQVTLDIYADDLYGVFGLSREYAYTEIIKIAELLFNRRFSYSHKNHLIRSRWIDELNLMDELQCVQISLSPFVIKMLDESKDILQEIDNRLSSKNFPIKNQYALRLYRLLQPYANKKNTMTIDLKQLRNELAVQDNQYKVMSNFKLRVLDMAVHDINANSDLKISYTQKKQGKVIVGFAFTVQLQSNKKPNELSMRDANTLDMFVNGDLTDAQINQIVNNTKFINDYNHLVDSKISSKRSVKSIQDYWIKQFKLGQFSLTQEEIYHYLKR